MVARLRSAFSNPLLPPVFFFAGVGYDTLTLSRIDRLQDNLILLLYLVLLGVLIILTGREEFQAGEREFWESQSGVLRWLGRAQPYYPMAMQFLLGGLFSALAAPLLFTRGVTEYWVCLVLVCLLRPGSLPSGGIDALIVLIADAGGRQWTAGELRSRRAVLHFFRSRCHSCDVEAAEIRALEARLPPDVVLLHVMTDAVLGFPPAETAATIAAKGFARPVLAADAAFVDAFHRVRWSNVTPITYVVDASGVIRFGLRGVQTAASIEAALAAAQ